MSDAFTRVDSILSKGGQLRSRQVLVERIDLTRLYLLAKRMLAVDELVCNESLARDGWEMIEAAAREIHDS